MTEKSKRITTEDITKLVNLCMEVNSLESRNKEQTGNKPTVFFNFSGHVAVIDVQIYPNGYEIEGDCIKHYFYTDREYGLEEYSKCVETLKKLTLPTDQSEQSQNKETIK